jgi:uncharacterized protein YjbI with pentapeptide repeats
MQILKSLHASVLHKSFRFNSKDIFCASALLGFDLRTGKIQLEQDLWKAISTAVGRDNLFDMCMPKDHPEFLAASSYFAPGGQSVPRGEARINFAGAEKSLRIHGHRHWQGGLGIHIPSDPLPFTEMPLNYTHAYGGEGYAENADGLGFCEIDLPNGKRGIPLPNVEHPHDLITSPSQRSRPASFMPISILSERRQKKSGTYDEAWLRHHAPGLAPDIDWSFFNDAEPDQWLPTFPIGGEAYTLHHLHPTESLISGKIPRVVARVFLTADKYQPTDFQELSGKIDTVWFFPSLMIGVIIFRYTIEDRYSGTKNPCIVIAHENYDDPRRPVEHYLESMRKRLDPETGFHWLLSFTDFLPLGSGSGLEDLLAGQKAPMESLTLNNYVSAATEHANAAKQQAEEEKAKMAEVLKAAGIDPETHFKNIASEAETAQTPQEKELQQLLAQLAELTKNDGSTPLDTALLATLIPRVMQLTAQLKESVPQRIEQNLVHLKQDASLWEALGPGVQIQIDEALKALPPLPRPPGKATLAKLQEDLAAYDVERTALLAQGYPEAQLPTPSIDLHSIQQKLEEADRAFVAAYRSGAHIFGAGRAEHADRATELRDTALAAIAQHHSMAGWDLAGLDFSGQNLAGADFSDAFLEDVNFSKATLTRAKFTRAILARANLTDADCSDADFAEASLGASQLTRTRFNRANLTRATLSNAKLEHTVFSESLLNEAQFLETVFDHVDFSRAQLARCHFLTTSFTGSTFAGAELSGSNFISPNLQGVAFNGATGNEVNFIEAKATGINFSHARFTNLRFVKDCDLQEAIFDHAHIEKSNLRGANLFRASLQHCQLNSTDFSEADLREANLQGSVARLAAFNFSNLQGSNLYRVNGMEATFLNARLVQTNMRESNWYSANFLQATLGETRFDHAILDKTILKDWRP